MKLILGTLLCLFLAHSGMGATILSVKDFHAQLRLSKVKQDLNLKSGQSFLTPAKHWTDTAGVKSGNGFGLTVSYDIGR
jgi:hypothetical protein